MADENKKEGEDELTLESLAEAVAAMREEIKALKPATDSDEPKEEKTEDEEPEEEKTEDEIPDDKTEAGPNAGVAGLDARLKKVESMDAKAIAQDAVRKALAEVDERNKLATDLSVHIGAFDHANKTLGEVAEYGVKKLGLKAVKGQEKAVLDGYLAAAKTLAAPARLKGADQKTTGNIPEALQHISFKK